MASISRDKNGTKRITFTDANGKRHTIRMGKMSVKVAEAFKARLERLIESRLSNTAINSDTAQWLAGLPDDTYTKLAKAGLVEPREQAKACTLGGMLDEYFKTISVKDATRIRYAQTQRRLNKHFGKDHPIKSITPHDADKWRTAQESTLSNPTISRDVNAARMFFKQAVRWGMIPSNPFEGVKAGAQTNEGRKHYLPPEEALKLIDAAPDADWRCIIALARFGGLRCPSEVLSVRWADIDWAANRFRVRSPKTEQHAGKGERVVPLFPELQTVLMDAFDRAPEGAEFVVVNHRSTTANLRTQLIRIIENAGMTAWPSLFNSMRASRVSELATQYPSATCTKWMGHSRKIAELHYHMVRDEDYAKAASTPACGSDEKSGSQSVTKCVTLLSQNASQHQAALRSREQQNQPQTKQGSALMPILAGRCRSLQNSEYGPGQT
ncbi:MAG: site-specific integrase [Phycisphaerales bacterium]|nr:site-specific integrase [Phycisphaerales bacterium]